VALSMTVSGSSQDQPTRIGGFADLREPILRLEDTFAQRGTHIGTPTRSGCIP